MKTIKFIGYLFYRYYSTGATKDIPYFSTLCALVMLVGLHVFQLLLIFSKFHWLDFINSNESRAKKFLLIGMCLIPLFVIASVLFKKSDVKELNYDENKIKQGYTFLIIYIIMSMALLILLGLYRQGKL